MCLIRLLELLVCVMTNYCQFSFKFMFKNYSEVINLSYFELNILQYVYIYAFNNGKSSWSRDEQVISATEFGAAGNSFILSIS